MKSVNLLFLFLFFTILINGCTGVRHLEDGEKLLYKQSIVDVDKANKDALSEQITLSPNTRIPLIGPLGASIYELGENGYDTADINQDRRRFIRKIDARIEEKLKAGKSTAKLEANKKRRLDRFENKLRNGNFAMRTGVPLAVYDSMAIVNSKERMLTYLNYNGFLKAEIEVEKKEKRRKVYQKFIVTEGPRSFIDSLTLRTGDSTLSQLINASKTESFLKIGEPYSKDKIDQERSRIESLMKDNGYFNFTKGFIEFDVFFKPNQLDLWISTVINKPSDKPLHQVYHMDSIVFNSYGSDLQTDTTEYQNITFVSGSNRYSPKVVDTRIIFRKGDLYNYTNVINTQRQLLAIDMFRYVNINFDTTLVPGKMVTNFYTAPLKKYQITQELGLNVNDYTSSSYPGPFYNLSLKDRNIFGGLEILELNGLIGIEGIAKSKSDESSNSNLQYGGNLSLSFPRFVTPFPSRKLNLITFNPRTAVSLGYSFTDRREYKRENINANLAFNWQNLKGNKNYTLTLSDVNLIYTPYINADFQKRLDQLEAQGNTLNLAFEPSFVMSTSFNATLNNDYSNGNSPSSFLRYFVEAGGSLLNITGKGLLNNNSLENYQFLKFQLDYRKYYPLSRSRALVFRGNIGVVDPYNGRDLPYEKYFFSGGSNSNRAWTPRRLGPGSAFPYLLDDNGDNVRDINGNLVPDRSKNSYRFEQPGEILLEFNAEYRANIASFIDWAFFIDAGNVWKFNDTAPPKDPTDAITLSPGADFKFDRFHKEIAVGAGLGLRFDFSFLVFRFDVGHKIRDPRYPDGNRWRKPFQNSNQTVWNIAVGYAF
ncbi:translocation and assembly module lipoprotein TamL [Roseivirga echinicomitans]